MAAHLPVESSWRMVEGANDSFDTSIVPTSFSQESDAAGNDNNDDPFTASGSAPSSLQPPLYSPPSLRETSTTGSRLVSGISAQGDQISLGGGDSFVSGSGSVSGSAGASQEDDIHSFLRKAESDKNVLLRSPFQPSVLSSVRQSPQSVASSVQNRRTDRGTHHTPEPELRMPVIGMDGSLHSAENEERKGKGVASKASTLAAAVLRRQGGFFGAGDTGSPSQKRTAPGGSLPGQTSSTPDKLTEIQGSSGTGLPATSAWGRLVLLFTLGLVAAYGAVAFTAGSTTLGSISTSTNRLYSTAIGTLCSVPGISNGIAACSPSAGHSTHVSTILRHRETAADDLDEPVSLVRSVGDLMRSQIQLASIVRTRVISSRHRNAAPVGADEPGSTVVPSFHDSWSVPRKRTKDLLAAARTQQKHSAQNTESTDAQFSDSSASSFLHEIEAYLGATQRVSAALAKLQSGAFTVAADNQVLNTRRIMSQLRRMDDDIKAIGSVSSGEGGDSSSGWLARLLSSKSQISTKRRREMLADVYRRHTKTLLAKTEDRVSDAKAALAELEATSKHLSAVQQYVDARLNGGSNAITIGTAPVDTTTTTSSFDWLWRLLGLHNNVLETNTSTQWAGYAEQLDTLRHEHDATASRIGDALDELSDVRDTLARLKSRLNNDFTKSAKADSVVFSSDDLDLDMQLHIDVVEAGLQDLEGMR